MIRVLPVVVELFLLVFCLIDCIQTPDHEVRNLPKVGWIILIIIIPLVGGAAWLVAGRPQRSSGSRVPWPSTATAGYPEHERPQKRALGPEDDPDFLRQMAASNREQEDLLRRWEEDLRRREDALRDPDGPQTTNEDTEPPTT
ncbi:MAG: hypothetical protein QOE01_2528 [Actinomycetota bacterium]|jgi:hypothetical protein|nr:hypothetical protein [Actinomycetota bacterium]